MSHPCDFFISYNKADRRWAEWIAWQLEENGYPVTLQAWHAQTGKNFIAWMHEASIDCGRTLALLSDAYFTGKFSLAEWTAAVAQGKLLPVRIQDINVPGLLGAISYIDLVDKDEDQVLEALLEGVRLPAKPETKPVFPGKIPHTVAQPTRFPGSLPPIWNVPYRRNPNFTGREEVLDALHEALRSGQVAALTQAISGLGGVGKTQLALEYAYRYRADYDLLWWIRSEEPTTLASDYALLAQQLDLPEKDAQEQDVVIQAVHRHLSQTKDWLLLFDNAGSPASVYPYLPQGEGGHVVITSRNPHWGNVASPLTIHTWKREESVAFLRARTGRDEAPGAAQIAEALGDLPLALEQAGAYIKETSLSFGAYLELLETRRRELWDEESAPLNYPDTVATTWSLAMDRVAGEEKTAAGRDILTFCAFLAPDSIPRSFLEHLPAHVPEERGARLQDVLVRNNGIKALSRYSLIQASPESLTVHRLVQAVARDRVPKEEAPMWVGAAVAIVDQAWPQGNFDAFAWPECERLMPHSAACLQHADTFEVSTAGVADLATRMAFYLQGRAAYAEAEPLYQRALEGYEQVLGPAHPDTLRSVNNLGYLLQAKGDLNGAEPLYRRALEGNEQVLGPAHPDTLVSVNNLALLLQARGDFDGAEPLLRRALEGYEQVLGPAHPDTLRSVNNLGTLLYSKSDFDGAEPLYRRALEGNEQVLGPTHPDTLRSVNNLGFLLQAKGDLDGAEPFFRHALEGLEKLLGSAHPTTKTVRGNLLGLLEEHRTVG